MTDTTTTEKPAAKRKTRKKVRKAAPAPLVKADGIYTGLTVTDCCDDCVLDGCVISGNLRCAHPRKGGLDSQGMQDQAALRRYQHAKRILGKQLLEARDT